MNENKNKNKRKLVLDLTTDIDIDEEIESTVPYSDFFLNGLIQANVANVPGCTIDNIGFVGLNLTGLSCLEEASDSNDTVVISPDKWKDVMLQTQKKLLTTISFSKITVYHTFLLLALAEAVADITDLKLLVLDEISFYSLYSFFVELENRRKHPIEKYTIPLSRLQIKFGIERGPTSLITIRQYKNVMCLNIVQQCACVEILLESDTYFKRPIVTAVIKERMAFHHNERNSMFSQQTQIGVTNAIYPETTSILRSVSPGCLIVCDSPHVGPTFMELAVDKALSFTSSVLSYQRRNDHRVHIPRDTKHVIFLGCKGSFSRGIFIQHQTSFISNFVKSLLDEVLANVAFQAITHVHVDSPLFTHIAGTTTRSLSRFMYNEDGEPRSSQIICGELEYEFGDTGDVEARRLLEFVHQNPSLEYFPCGPPVLRARLFTRAHRHAELKAYYLLSVCPFVKFLDIPVADQWKFGYLMPLNNYLNGRCPGVAVTIVRQILGFAGICKFPFPKAQAKTKSLVL